MKKIALYILNISSFVVTFLLLIIPVSDIYTKIIKCSDGECYNLDEAANIILINVIISSLIASCIVHYVFLKKFFTLKLLFFNLANIAFAAIIIFLFI